MQRQKILANRTACFGLHNSGPVGRGDHVPVDAAEVGIGVADTKVINQRVEGRNISERRDVQRCRLGGLDGVDSQVRLGVEGYASSPIEPCDRPAPRWSGHRVVPGEPYAVVARRAGEGLCSVFREQQNHAALQCAGSLIAQDRGPAAILLYLLQVAVRRQVRSREHGKHAQRGLAVAVQVQPFAGGFDRQVDPIAARAGKERIRETSQHLVLRWHEAVQFAGNDAADVQQHDGGIGPVLGLEGEPLGGDDPLDGHRSLLRDQARAGPEGQQDCQPVTAYSSHNWSSH